MGILLSTCPKSFARNGCESSRSYGDAREREETNRSLPRETPEAELCTLRKCKRLGVAVWRLVFATQSERKRRWPNASVSLRADAIGTEARSTFRGASRVPQTTIGTLSGVRLLALCLGQCSFEAGIEWDRGLRRAADLWLAALPKQHPSR